MSDKPHNAGGQESELTANARKALRMKTEAGPQTRIPEHETAREGGVGARRAGQPHRHDGRQGADLHPQPEAQPQRPHGRRLKSRALLRAAPRPERRDGPAVPAFA